MRSSNGRIIRDYGITISAAAFIALVIRFFIIEAYRIPSQAMRPTLEAGDTIFVSKYNYGLKFPGSSKRWLAGSTPARGDVVVFSSDSGFSGATKKIDYIKRVLGLPGDIVQVKSGHLLLNGVALSPDPKKRNQLCGQESLGLAVAGGLAYSVCQEPPLMEDFGPEKVPAGSVFVIGDSRTQQGTEARKNQNWGMIPMDSLKGKALWIWLSVEPRSVSQNSGLFPQFRFERMFRRIQ